MRTYSNLNPEYLRLRIATGPYKKRAIAKILKVKLYTLSDWTQGRVRIPLIQGAKIEQILDWGEMIYGRTQIRVPKYITEP